jgi:hypothetical protein
MIGIVPSRGIASSFYSRTAEVENAVATDSWTALSRIAAAARAMTMRIEHAATKLRIVVLHDLSLQNNNHRRHKLHSRIPKLLLAAGGPGE